MFYLNQFRNPFWNFDATGSILKPIKNQKRPYLYSIVSYDPENHINFPFCEWFSTCHTQSSISQFLFTIKNILKRYASISSKKIMFKFAPIIVTDYSFALLNSVLIVFNSEMRRKIDNEKHEMLIYLDIAYETLVLNKTDRFDDLSTFIYICSTHFLYNFIKKVKKVTASETLKEKSTKKKNKQIQQDAVKRFAIFCFSLLINATSLNEFNIYLQNSFYFLMEKTQSVTFLTSLLFIRDRIRERKIQFLVSLDPSPKYIRRQKDFDELLNRNNEDFKKNKRQSIKKSCQFFDYFAKKISELTNLLQKDCTGKKNPFFQPDLFQLIQKQLYLAPVWSGFFINQHFKRNEEFYKKSYYNKNFPTKLENNRVENRFDNLKHDQLQDNRVFPSEFAKITYSNIKSQFINPKNDYINRQNELSKQLTNLDEYDENNNLIKKVQADFQEPKEKWDNSSEKKKRRQKKTNGYFDNISNFGYVSSKTNNNDLLIIDELDENFIQDQLSIFDTIVEICQSK